MNKRKKIIIIALVLLLIMVLIWLLLRQQSLVDQTNTNTNPENVFKPPSQNLQYQPVLSAPETAAEFTAITLAKNYAERFGSWSTDKQGKNLEELTSLSTSKMQTYLQGIKLEAAAEFYGVSTKTIASEIRSLDDKQAVILVKTQREEKKGNLDPVVKYQDILITLIKNNNNWLVDSAIWQ